jgi:hypothetical protein
LTVTFVGKPTPAMSGYMKTGSKLSSPRSARIPK